jgi:hypothetical protein
MFTPAFLKKSIIFWRVRNIVKSDYWLCYVCPSFRMEQLGSHWADFHYIWNLDIFRKNYWEKLSFIKIWQEQIYFTWRPMYIFDRISLSSS